ncbi:MAG: leucyl/phenylalanyl-tRNA--protein transferase [Gammaproteobacteria bacterium]|jgi:leucyl/phenylalanyl-tRNA--protein transferase
MTIRITWIDATDPADAFPPVSAALTEPEGLLAAGGDLSPERLLAAYRMGIFPWYEAGQPILWWSPNPRAVLFADELRISRSLRKTLRRGLFEPRLDCDFAAVVDACAAPRAGQRGTWITPEMSAAYCRLHQLGWAHSVETWQQGRLVGGLYGVAIGRVFFGESMFSRVSDASKVALAHLVRECRTRGIEMIDCQLPSPHLARLGARLLERGEFLSRLRELTDPADEPGKWHCHSADGSVEWKIPD